MSGAMNTARYRKIRAMAADTGAAAAERATARRLLHRMEAEHPTIRSVVAQEEARERVDAASKAAPQPAQDGPGPYDTGYYGPGRATTRAEAPWVDRVRSFVRAAVDEVGLSFTVADLIRQDVEIKVSRNRRTVHVHVRIPVESLEDAADHTGGPLDEYARLVGARVGSTLSDLFRRSG